MEADPHGKLTRLGLGASALLALVFLAQLPQTGALFTFVGSAAGGAVASRLASLQELGGVPRVAYRWTTTACLVVVSVVVVTRIVNAAGERRHEVVRYDMMSDEDRSLDDWFRRHAAADEIVLTPILPRAELQSKVTHPVLFELETLWLIAYMPRLAPVIGEMAKDLYGVDYTNPKQQLCSGGGLSTYCRAWTAAWERRSRDEWKALSAKYDFRLVLAPPTTMVHLDAAWTGRQWTLYEIR